MLRRLLILLTVTAVAILVATAIVVPRFVYRDVDSNVNDRDKQLLRNAVTRPRPPHLVERVVSIESDGREPPAVNGRVEYRSFFGVKAGSSELYDGVSSLNYSLAKYIWSIIAFRALALVTISLVIWQAYTLG